MVKIIVLIWVIIKNSKSQTSRFMHFDNLLYNVEIRRHLTDSTLLFRDSSQSVPFLGMFLSDISPVT
jgi:hypothetical protein